MHLGNAIRTLALAQPYLLTACFGSLRGFSGGGVEERGGERVCPPAAAMRELEILAVRVGESVEQAQQPPSYHTPIVEQAQQPLINELYHTRSLSV